MDTSANLATLTEYSEAVDSGVAALSCLSVFRTADEARDWLAAGHEPCQTDAALLVQFDRYLLAAMNAAHPPAMYRTDAAEGAFLVYKWKSGEKPPPNAVDAQDLIAAVAGHASKPYRVPQALVPPEHFSDEETEFSTAHEWALYVCERACRRVKWESPQLWWPFSLLDADDFAGDVLQAVRYEQLLLCDGPAGPLLQDMTAAVRWIPDLEWRRIHQTLAEELTRAKLALSGVPLPPLPAAQATTFLRTESDKGHTVPVPVESAHKLDGPTASGIRLDGRDYAIGSPLTRQLVAAICAAPKWSLEFIEAAGKVDHWGHGADITPDIAKRQQRNFNAAVDGSQWEMTLAGERFTIRRLVG